MRTLVLLGLAGACSGGSSASVTISPYRVPCVAAGPMSCLEGTDEQGEPQLFFDGIEGFTFRWGETREVAYLIHEVEDPPPDSSSLRYEAIEDTLVATAAPSDRFVLSFRESSFFTPGSATDRVRFFSDELACAPALCQELLAQPSAFRVRFEYAAPAGAVATALAIE